MYRLAAAFAALVLGVSLAACSEQKATGLPDGPTKEAEPLTDVRVIDNQFSPADLTIKPGEEITWIFEGAAPHNVQAANGSFNSHPQCGSDITKCSVANAPAFKRAFPSAGTFAYFCVIHGTANGTGMFGRIIVQG